jgi:hypothetical protein
MNKLAVFLLVVLLSGCATRTIYVPDGSPVRIARPIPKAHVWVLDKDGKWAKGRVDIPEGWYALPDPADK